MFNEPFLLFIMEIQIVVHKFLKFTKLYVTIYI